MHLLFVRIILMFSLIHILITSGNAKGVIHSAINLFFSSLLSRCGEKGIFKFNNLKGLKWKRFVDAIINLALSFFLFSIGKRSRALHSLGNKVSSHSSKVCGNFLDANSFLAFVLVIPLVYSRNIIVPFLHFFHII